MVSEPNDRTTNLDDPKLPPEHRIEPRSDCRWLEGGNHAIRGARCPRHGVFGGPIDGHHGVPRLKGEVRLGSDCFYRPRSVDVRPAKGLTSTRFVSLQ